MVRERWSENAARAAVAGSAESHGTGALQREGKCPRQRDTTAAAAAVAAALAQRASSGEILRAAARARTGITGPEGEHNVVIRLVLLHASGHPRTASPHVSREAPISTGYRARTLRMSRHCVPLGHFLRAAALRCGVPHDASMRVSLRLRPVTSPGMCSTRSATPRVLLSSKEVADLADEVIELHDGDTVLLLPAPRALPPVGPHPQAARPPEGTAETNGDAKGTVAPLAGLIGVRRSCPPVDRLTVRLTRADRPSAGEQRLSLRDGTATTWREVARQVQSATGVRTDKQRLIARGGAGAFRVGVEASPLQWDSSVGAGLSLLNGGAAGIGEGGAPELVVVLL